MKKRYQVRISFGDGNPIEDTVDARSGSQAQDIAMWRHPGARNVHLIGIDNRFEKQKPAVTRRKEQKTPLLFTDAEEWAKETQIECCVKLRLAGKSHLAIANELGVSKTTIGRWLKQYG